MTVDRVPADQERRVDMSRQSVMGRHWAVAAGHPLAAQAGARLLEAGGNAVDAGVAAGLALGVVHNDMVSLAGVAPIMVALAESGEVMTIDGLGTWPRGASIEFFRDHYGGDLPPGILRTVIPAAPDAWLTALERWGTKSFPEVAAPAFELARDGFPVSPFTALVIEENAADFARWPENASVYLPGGRPLKAGEILKQPDLAWSLDVMIQSAQQAGGGRKIGIAAARDAFYRGEIARKILLYHREHGGLLTAEDLASYRVRVEPPVSVPFGEYRVYTCGFWSQGPVLAQTLNLLAGGDLRSLGHNNAAYIHRLVEALKLAFADRELYYGDPAMVKIPVKLLDPAYARERRGLIQEGKAWAGFASREDAVREPSIHDTSYVAVVDREGNCFSATPSDPAVDGPIVPGTGFVASPRGSQSWLDPNHPSCLAPGKRPRLTPNPAIVTKDGRGFMPFGTPGGDVQCQAMLQVLLNVLVFGLAPQDAVEAPRFVTYAFPDSFWPHQSYPGWLNLEARIPTAVGEELTAWGHQVVWWGDWAWRAGCVCAIALEGGARLAAADPRRGAYALGW